MLNVTEAKTKSHIALRNNQPHMKMLMDTFFLRVAMLLIHSSRTTKRPQKGLNQLLSRCTYTSILHQRQFSKSFFKSIQPQLSYQVAVKSHVIDNTCVNLRSTTALLQYTPIQILTFITRYCYYLVMFPRTRNSYGFMYVKEFGCTWCLLVNYEVGDLFFELNDNWETVRLEGKEGGG